MNVLITGGFGYLGGRLAQSLFAGGHRIRLGSRADRVPPRWLGQADVTRTDWESSTGLQAACTGVDAVVHAAGMNARDCAADPAAALSSNSVATARLLAAAIGAGVRRVVFISTAHVYGSPLSGLITERTCPAPVHPYATSRRAGEDVVKTAHHHGRIEGVIVRLSNAYGPPSHPEADCWSLLVNDLGLQAVTTNRMVLHTSGRQRRDFIPMTDACRAIEHLLRLPVAPNDDPVFNVGGGESPTVLAMAERLADRVLAQRGQRPSITRAPDQGGDEAPLEYGLTKLLETGFNLSGPGATAVERELDALIRCCVDRASQPLP